jgi:hypothetical protein
VSHRRWISAIALTLVTSALGLASGARAVTVVTNENDAGVGSLRQAVIDAVPGDTITFLGGVSSVKLTSGEIAINKNLTISGAGSVTITRQSSSSPFTLVHVQASTSVRLDGLTLTNGDGAPSGGSQTIGGPGAILNEGLLTLSDCSLSANRGGAGSSDAGGPGAITNTGVLQITDSTLSNNAGGAGAGNADDGGAGAISTAGPLAITGSMIAGNVGGNGGQGAFGGKGGAGAVNGAGSVQIADSTISTNRGGTGGDGVGGDGGAGAIGTAGTLGFTDSVLSGNTGGGGGSEQSSGSQSGVGGSGAISNGGTLDLAGTTLAGNTGGTGGGGGDGANGGAGALANSATAKITESTLTTNTGGAGADGATDDGSGGAGGISNSAGLEVIRSTLSGNAGGTGGFFNGSGGGGAGAIGSTAGAVDVTNSTLFGNIGGDGFATASGDGGAGGIGSTGGTVTLLHSTIAGNTGGVPGPNAGVAGAGGIAGSATVRNTVLAANAPNSCSGTITDGGHNIAFPVGGCPATFGNGDPKLGPLQNNAGPTLTMALGANSSAIDIVPTGAGCPPTDQRGAGFTRPKGPACDAGAFEAPAAVSGGGGANPGPGAGGGSDTTPPDTSITSGPDRSKATTRRGHGSKLPSTRDRTPNFSFTSTEAGSTFQCSVDGGAFTSCASPFTIPSKLERGKKHVFAVRAIDPAGNVDPSPASLEFKVKQK